MLPSIAGARGGRSFAQSATAAKLNAVIRTCVILLTLFALSLTATSCGGGASPAASPSPSGLVDIGEGLSGPAGLKASVYSRGVPNAAAFAFDDQGRLWIATADYTDSGSDGVYLVPSAGATAQLVIPNLHTALGLLWYHGALYVSSKERVDAYSGFDGARFTNSKSVLSLPIGVGEVNGLVFGPDGRMRVGVSAPCDHCQPDSKWSAAVLSFLPDGSDLQVEASGIRAPIDFAYYPGTNDLFVTMNQRDDLGQPRRAIGSALFMTATTGGSRTVTGREAPSVPGRPRRSQHSTSTPPSVASRSWATSWVPHSQTPPSSRSGAPAR